MKKHKRIKKIAALLITVLILLPLFSIPALAAAPDSTGVSDVDAMFSNFMKFISGLVHIVGAVMVLFAIVQIGMSISSHDSTQRMQGFLLIAGGVIIFFAPQILSFISGSTT